MIRTPCAFSLLHLGLISFLLPIRMIFAQATNATGAVAGRVIITQKLMDDSEIASRSIIRQYALETGRYTNGQPRNEERAQHLVVFLEPLAQPAVPLQRQQQAVVVMDQKNERFIPHVLAIERGTVVRFLNSDSIYHNVFSLSPAKSFDLGRYPKGKYKAVRFDKAGIVKVYCDIHTQMNAYILVLDTPYFTLTEADGRFRLDDVPSGTYRLKVWYGNWESRPKQITVSSGKTNNLEIRFP